MIESKYGTYINKKISKDKLNAYQIESIRMIYQARLLEEIYHTACDPLDYLSAIGWSSFESHRVNQIHNSNYSDDETINIKGGYASFVNYFVTRISTSRIRLNEVVRFIDYSMANKVRVTTQNRLSGGMSVFEADQVLVTIPLGYLKLNHRSMFNPPLSAAKSSAIDRLGFGVVNKIFLVFNEDFGFKVQGVQMLWRQGLGISLNSMVKWGIDVNSSITSGFCLDFHAFSFFFKQRYFYESIGSFEVHPKMKNILYSWIGGSNASFTESLPDQCILEVLSELLMKYFPKIIKKPPKSIIR